MATLGDVIAANVRAERGRLKLDQAALAERLGWSKSTVSNLESGRRTVAADDIVPLCRALQVTFAQLIYRLDDDQLAILAL